MLGLGLGLVWSPCVGPTLGAASTLASQGRHLSEIALLMLLLSLGYVYFGALPWTAALLLGLKCAVVVLIAQALWRLARRSLQDRATRWVYLRIYAHQDEAASIDFLRRLHQAAPMKIKTVLTDNGSQFTDRFTSKTRAPSGQHAFDRRCVELGIEHRLCPPRHPQTNGMVERFNGRVSEVIAQTRFKSAQELETTLTNYLATYNHRIPQRALNHLSPVQALKQWQAKRPELFSKRVYELSGLDSY